MASIQFSRTTRGGEASTSSSPSSSILSPKPTIACRRQWRRTNRCCPSRHALAAASRRLVVVSVSSATPQGVSSSSASCSSASAASGASAAAVVQGASTPTATHTATTPTAASTSTTSPLAVILEPPSSSSPVLQTGGDDGTSRGGLPPSGGAGGDGDGEGDGGGDGDDGGEGRRQHPSFWLRRLNPFAAIAAGVGARCRADPEFVYKLLVECGLDLSIILGVNLAARGGARFFSELEFVLSQAAVSLLNDFALVYLLAPTAAVKGAHAAARGSIAAALASLPAHVFQSGSYGTGARLACLGTRAAQYGAVGLVMGCAGSAIVRALVAAREAADAGYEPPPMEQGIVDTGLAWCYFMAVSSNLRYNAINGVEEWAYSRARSGAGAGVGAGLKASPALFLATPAAARSLSVALRLANNVFGAHSFIQLAKVLKLDKPRELKKNVVGGRGERDQWWKRPRAVVA